MRRIFISAVILSLLFLCSCFYIRVDYPYEEGRVPMEDYHKVVPFEPGGTLSLENVNGDVEIAGWEREELDVYARKIVQWPERTRVYVYPWNEFSPGIVFDQFEDFVKIRTKSAAGDEEAGTVHFSIDVPHSINLKDIVVERGTIIISEVYGEIHLDLAEGDVVLDGFSGSLSASVITGSIEASLYDLREQDEIVITSKEGDITLSLEEDVRAHIEASFPNGEISSDFDFEIPSDKKEIDWQLGEGGTFISLTALNGQIKINKIEKD